MPTLKEAVTTSINGKLSYLEPVALSELGTPVIDNIKFIGGKFKDLQGNDISYESLTINDAVLTVGRSKQIVTSTINGRPGTVKEYITAMDFNIGLVGTINSIIGFPAQKWKAFSQIEAVPEPIKVVSKFLNSIFGIDYVVITDFETPQEGSINSFEITIQMLSDEQLDFQTFEGALLATGGVTS